MSKVKPHVAPNNIMDNNKEAKRYTVIGLMSGTSLDGVDAAVLYTDGREEVETGAHYFRPYREDERALLAQTMQDALVWNFTGPSPHSFARAETMIDAAHKEAAQALMKEARIKTADVDLIGYHGQTVLHRAPKGRQKGQTLQIGNGQDLADSLGLSTVYDFRTADVAAGGQGAPLAPVYHKSLVRGADGVTAVLNIGGVSNITIVMSGGELLATDCGPGNGPLDMWVSRHDLGDYDKDGRLSLSGTPDIALLEAWMARSFFQLPVPRSADRYDFDVLSSMDGLSVEDGAATLAAFCSFGVQNALRKYRQAIDKVIVCGGGRHNRAIMAALTQFTNAAVINSDDLAWAGDALEAQAFAYMAVRHIKGLPISYPDTTGVPKPMTGGKLAKPIKNF